MRYLKAKGSSRRLDLGYSKESTMKFDYEKFLSILKQSNAFDYRQLKAIGLAARVAAGKDVPEEGMVYQSTRGVRLVVRKGDLYSLVCLKAFDPQYDETVGKFVGRKDQDLADLESYMTSRLYKKVGPISKVDVSKLKKGKS